MKLLHALLQHRHTDGRFEQAKRHDIGLRRDGNVLLAAGSKRDGSRRQVLASVELQRWRPVFESISLAHAMRPVTAIQNVEETGWRGRRKTDSADLLNIE